MTAWKTSRRALLSVALFATFAAGCGLKTRGPAPPERAQAPAFALPSHTGKTVTLADLTKKGPAILVFYRGYW